MGRHGRWPGPGEYRPHRWLSPDVVPGAFPAPTPDARFVCSNCGRPLSVERVVRIDAERRWAVETGAARRRRTGFVVITHHCDCAAQPVSSRRCASYEAFVALFGRGVRLPYVAPFAYVELTDGDPRLGRWRFELELVAGVDDFELWLAAERRKPFDESRRRRRDGAPS